MPQLSAPPALAPLFVRSFLTAGLPRGKDLADTVLSVTDQAIERERLVAYQRVCGYRVQDVLPPLFLHLLAFPLAVQLMADRSFPFALPGLVHIANDVRVHRPVTADERVSLRVHAARLRDHPAGRQVELVAEAQVGDELVWESASTYLRRAGAAKDAGERARQELDPQQGPIAVLRVPDDIGRRYAGVSGDRNPIHLHPLTARAFGFPRAIAHGMWLEARVLATLESRLPAAFEVAVAFKTPVLLPSTVAVATPATDAGHELDVRSATDGRPHLTGRVAALH